ncbi:MAG: PEP-CTERM sorting domain-containing protein [Rhodospirillaceae bacterium]
MNTKAFVAAALAACMIAAPASASFIPNYSTDFDSFALGTINGQDGWSANRASSPPWDEAIVSLGGGNNVWRISNQVNSGTFSDQPFAPRPGGIPTVTTTLAGVTNGNPQEFAGQSSTGAQHRTFFAEFDFKSATDTPQDGARITISPDNGNGGRQAFAALRDTGTGVAIDTFDVDAGGGFSSAVTIGTVSYGAFHTLRIEIDFNDGIFDDVARYFLDDALVHTDKSWESFYTNFQAASHPLGVPVQTLLFRLSSAPVDNVAGGGFYIDNVAFGFIPEPGTLAVFGLGLLGLAALRRRDAHGATPA